VTAGPPSLSSWVDPPVSAVHEVVARALAEDLEPLGDVTAALLDPTATGAASGRRPVGGRRRRPPGGDQGVHRPRRGITVAWRLADGTVVAPGDVVATVSGPVAAILSAERTALNLLCHLSGIATLTARYVAAAPGAQIWDTRKTTPGLRALEKAAGAGRRRRQPPRQPLGVGAPEGQPPGGARCDRGRPPAPLPLAGADGAGRGGPDRAAAGGHRRRGRTSCSSTTWRRPRSPAASRSGATPPVPCSRCRAASRSRRWARWPPPASTSSPSGAHPLGARARHRPRHRRRAPPAPPAPHVPAPPNEA
jgi:hypothetical protein